MSEHANYLTPRSQKMFFAVLNCQGSIRSIPFIRALWFRYIYFDCKTELYRTSFLLEIFVMAILDVAILVHECILLITETDFSATQMRLHESNRPTRAIS